MKIQQTPTYVKISENSANNLKIRSGYINNLLLSSYGYLVSQGHKLRFLEILLGGVCHILGSEYVYIILYRDLSLFFRVLVQEKK